MADGSKVMGGVMVIIGIIVVLCIILCTFYLYYIYTDVSYIANSVQAGILTYAANNVNTSSSGNGSSSGRGRNGNRSGRRNSNNQGILNMVKSIPGLL